jgi:hypothetical protein
LKHLIDVLSKLTLEAKEKQENLYILKSVIVVIIAQASHAWCIHAKHIDGVVVGVLLGQLWLAENDEQLQTDAENQQHNDDDQHQEQLARTLVWILRTRWQCVRLTSGRAERGVEYLKQLLGVAGVQARRTHLRLDRRSGGCGRGKSGTRDGRGRRCWRRRSCNRLVWSGDVEGAVAYRGWRRRRRRRSGCGCGRRDGRTDDGCRRRRRGTLHGLRFMFERARTLVDGGVPWSASAQILDSVQRLDFHSLD